MFNIYIFAWWLDSNCGTAEEAALPTEARPLPLYLLFVSSSHQFFLPPFTSSFFLRWIFTWGGNKPATTVTNPRLPTTHTLSLSLFISHSLSLSHTFIHSHTTTPYQCDQIGLLLKSLGDIFSNKISPNIGQLFVLFKKTLFLRNNWFGSVLGNFG